MAGVDSGIELCVKNSGSDKVKSCPITLCQTRDFYFSLNDFLRLLMIVIDYLCYQSLLMFIHFLIVIMRK